MNTTSSEQAGERDGISRIVYYSMVSTPYYKHSFVCASARTSSFSHAIAVALHFTTTLLFILHIKYNKCHSFCCCCFGFLFFHFTKRCVEIMQSLSLSGDNNKKPFTPRKLELATVTETKTTE